MKIQSYAFNSRGKLVWAGVDTLRHVSRREARRLQGKWKAWRKSRGDTLTSEYRVRFICMHPLDDERTLKQFTI